MTVCIQINVLGLCVMTREFIKQLRERGVDDGHVIFMNRCIMDIPVLLYSCKFLRDLYFADVTIFARIPCMSITNFALFLMISHGDGITSDISEFNMC